ARRHARGVPSTVAGASPCRAARPNRNAPPLRRGARQPDHGRHARHRSVALQAGVLRRDALRSAVRQVAAHQTLPGRAVPTGALARRLGRMDLGRGGAAGMIVSRNEIESLALKAARGAGMSWGLAEEASVGAGWLADSALPWAGTLTALPAQVHTTSAPQVDVSAS